MGSLKRYKRSEVREARAQQHAMFIIDNLVYDVRGYLEDHPGGHEVLTDVAGTDASKQFRDIGHSREARQRMTDYLVGELVDEDKSTSQSNHNASVTPGPGVPSSEESFLVSWKFSLAVALVLTGIHMYVFDLYNIK